MAFVFNSLGVTLFAHALIYILRFLSALELPQNWSFIPQNISLSQTLVLIDTKNTILCHSFYVSYLNITAPATSALYGTGNYDNHFLGRLTEISQCMKFTYLLIDMISYYPTRFTLFWKWDNQFLRWTALYMSPIRKPLVWLGRNNQDLLDRGNALPLGLWCW